MDRFLGKRLDGRYEIKEIIGVGGMANVYHCYDSIDDREVAIKILKDEFLDNEDFIRRFKNESKAIAVLNHPNIVRVYDVSFGDMIQYIVMEYIEGINLKEFIEREGSLRWKDAVHFTLQILKGLQHAHDKGIVHRDVKPQNVMLLQDGTIKVMDFGIARFARENGRTLSDKTIGSVHYISPEQARGEHIDERSDVYSVGVMLYEMLTGKKPFDGENPVAIALKHMEEEAKLPCDVMPSIPEALEEIVIHAMEKNPAKRYQSAAEMIKDIDAFKADRNIVFGYKNSHQLAENTAVDEYDEYDEYEDEYEDKKRSYVVPILMAVTVAVVIIASLIIAYFVISRMGVNTHTGNVEIENFVGQSIVDVEQKYNGKLKFKVSQEYNDQYEEGIIFDLLTNPIEIIADDNGWVTGMKCVKMELGEPDASGRRRPVEVAGSEFEMELDTVIMSLGTSPNPLISSTTESLEVNKWKCIVADEEHGKTTKEGVYAGGDAVTGAATVILAMGAGIVGDNLALEIVDTFLNTEFSGEERHQRRIDLIED